MTAVEWLISKIERNENPSLTQKEIIEYVNQAKEMEKQQSYSEEEVLDITKQAYSMGRSNYTIKAFNEWFKQFKKK